jgi:energy-coupling factor transporter ATP-binding protein EcfA2
MIFINYRYQDSNSIVALLAHRLASEFGDKNVFVDITTIQFGDKWSRVLERMVRDCEIMLVLIGHAWDRVKFESGRYKNMPRLIDPDDWVRREITTAIKLSKKIIPVLLENASLPDREWLSNFELEDICDYQAAHLRVDQFEHDFGLLIEVLVSISPELTEYRDRQGRSGVRRARNSSTSVPVMINRLQVIAFRRIQSLDFIRCQGAEGSVPSRGQWTLLLGDNGTGKTSLLWAISLALQDEKVAYGLMANLSSPMIRGKNAESKVTLDSSRGEFSFGIENTDRQEKFAVPPSAADFMVVAYGNARGSAFGGPDRAVELDRPMDDVGTLFGMRTFLVHAETWLRNLEHRELKKKNLVKSPSLYDTVRSTLLSILPGIDKMEIDENHVRFSGPAVGDCILGSLSDGYATTLGWVVDMMARWIYEQQKMDVEIKPNFNLEMTGLALLDELDLHLHPRWQVRIVSDLRKAFPKMSFMATTHNPLTLLGAEPGEVHVLCYEGDELHIEQLDLPPGIRADQVLTGAWFGLSSTLDQETQKMLEEHRNLLRKRTPQSNPKRRKLEKEIRLRLGSYADTSEDRLAQEIVSKQIDGEYAELTDEDRKNIQANIIEAIAKRK